MGVYQKQTYSSVRDCTKKSMHCHRCVSITVKNHDCELQRRTGTITGGKPSAEERQTRLRTRHITDCCYAWRRFQGNVSLLHDPWTNVWVGADIYFLKMRSIRTNSSVSTPPTYILRYSVAALKRCGYFMWRIAFREFSIITVKVIVPLMEQYLVECVQVPLPLLIHIFNLVKTVSFQLHFSFRKEVKHYWDLDVLFQVIP